MGCTIYAASSEAPSAEGPKPQRRPLCYSSRTCRNRVRQKTMSDHQDQAEDVRPLSPHDQTESSKDDDMHFRLHLIDDLSYEDVKKCYRGSWSWDNSECPVSMLSLVQSTHPLRERGSLQKSCAKQLICLSSSSSSASSQTVSKYNAQYHKLFQSVPKDELLMKVYSCALLRDILLQGRLYISRNWLCFYANLFGKDIKVAIPVVSVRLVKKHKTAGLVPNGLAITTDSSQKYVFVSLLSRDSVYDVLRRICTHLQVNGKKVLSLKQYMEEPNSMSLDEYPVPEVFPVPDEFPPVLKWRRKPSVASVASSLPDLLGNSASSLSAVDANYQTEKPQEDQSFESKKSLLTESIPELGQTEYQLLKFFILLIILLILSSCYLAFRVCSLEQQLSFLSNNPSLTLRER
ncbi:hypothetical protein DNTS_003646 [Danionella cerebrum]|nr:hypothetical protein DNTS_003646 [Danionella translucida]